LKEAVEHVTASNHVYAPADLILLLNEAAPAMLAAPFIQELIQRKIDFSHDGQSFPLLVSMTSEGDPATKLAFPGGEFISPNRPSTVGCPNEKVLECNNGLDTFGQKSTIAYNLLTTANMQALQSHTFEVKKAQENCRFTIKLNEKGDQYCIARKTAKKGQPSVENKTPYWVMQMPEAFVPDHGSVFRDEVGCIIRVFLAERGEVNADDCQSRGGTHRRVSALIALPHATVSTIKPTLSVRVENSPR
jgi:hypothetical protein